MCEVELRDRIGQGGNAEVFESAHTKDGNACVVKRAHRDAVSFLQLKNEWKILCLLKEMGYGHAPEVYEYSGKELVMELVDGTSLSKLLLSEYSESKLKALLLDICETVKELHELRCPVIHRDIKPSNIMMDKNGRIYLIDFGTAIILEGYEERGLSKGVIKNSQDFVGTKRFASPEQFGGLSTESFGTDIYQIGKTIRYLMKGAKASKGFMESMSKVAEMCCAPRPEDRYHSVSEIIADIMNIKESRERHLFFLKKTVNKCCRGKRRKMRGNTGKTTVFIDIVRTFDTIEFL